MALPTEEELGACPDLSNVLPPWCLKYLEGDHERMLQVLTNANASALLVTPRRTSHGSYSPTQLHYRQYLRLIKKLDQLRFLRGPCILKGLMGTFFVRNKNSKIRMMLDARRTNQRFCKPPSVALATAETLADLSPFA